MKKIKILFIQLCLLCGGTEQALYDLLRFMDKDRFDITVLTQIDGGIWEEKFREAGIRVISPWSCQKKSGNPFVKLQNMRKRLLIRRALKNDGRGLLEICTERNFDIIVSYGIYNWQHMGFSGNAKTVKFIHSDVATNAGDHKSVEMGRDLMRRFDRIICVSETARRSFTAETGISENIVTHLNPIDSARVRRLAGEEAPLPDCSVPTICAVGRMEKTKGFARLLRIHRRIVESGVPHRLVIVGDGTEMANLRQIADDLGAGESVVFTGYRANPCPYIKASRFTVCPSYTEGLHLVSMESLILGVPVVSALPVVGELFCGEVCGIITGNDDASLEAGIRRMLTDDAFCAKARAGAERAGSRFDGRRMAAGIEAEFAALVGATGGE